MKLPNAELATVPERKITHYLLNPAHPAGGSKAWLFLNFGFTITDWQRLADASLHLTRENEVVKTEVTPYGGRYVVDGRLLAPDSTSLNVRTVWYISVSGGAPRFVTAHPLPKL
jgi:Domain of unknown function (DUF6883)